MDILTILSGITSVVGLFAMVASITPNESDDKYAQMLLNLINNSGFNVGNAKNK